MSAPRVAHLVFDLIRGGTEGQCARIAMGLARRGLPHRVAAFHRRGFFLANVEAACGAVYEVPIRHAAQLSTVREIVRLAKWLRQENMDILHTWDADAAIFGQFSAQLAGVTLVTSRRDLGQIYPPWKQSLLRRADRVASRTVANAVAVREHFIAQGAAAEKMVVLPNILDVEERDRLAQMPFSRATELPQGRRMVVVNRLDPEKNTGHLIAALPLVRKKIPTAVLIVAGDGCEMPTLRAQALSLGVSDVVCFLGETNEIPALLPMCEAGALVPTRNEGLSNTVLEFMAAWLPVLATDCGGNRELVQDGVTGRLVPTSADSQTLAGSWISLLQEREREISMGQKARQHVEQRHRTSVALDLFEKFYSHL